MDIGLKIRRNQNFHYIRYDPLRPTEELTQPFLISFCQYSVETRLCQKWLV